MPPPTKDLVAVVRRVWIELGCIQCGWCTDLIPAVFSVSASHRCVIRGEVLADGRTTPNRDERRHLAAPLLEDDARYLDFVAAGCPANVIKFAED